MTVLNKSKEVKMLKLANKKIKKLLHTQRQVKSLQERLGGKTNDDRIHKKFVTPDEVKKDGDSVFNKIRRDNAKNELNQYQHVESQHIRLKPYYDAGLLVHWVGIVSDVTIPRKVGQPEGAILIDKASTEDGGELLDYHLWLNITEIKFLAHEDKMQVGIGDYIEGLSYIKPYGKNKYGLGTTLISDCGIYFGTNKYRSTITEYNHGDDWVLKLENGTASLRAKKKYVENNLSLLEASKEAGHVTTTYQPSRYNKFQERIGQETIDDEKPLPLVPDTQEKYFSTVIKPYASRTINENEYEYRPMISVGEIINVDHKRVIAKSANLPYLPQLAKMGLVKQGDPLIFTATAGKGGQLLDVKRIEIPANTQVMPIPSDPEALSGYFLFMDSKEGDMKTPQGSKCLKKFLDWAREKDINPNSLKHVDKDWNTDGSYKASDISTYLHVPKNWLDNMIEQHILVPSNDNSNVDQMTFNGKELDKIQQIMQANSEVLCKEITQRYHLYRAKDMADELGVSEQDVVNIIITSKFKSFHKFYGKNVFDIVKKKIDEKRGKQLRDDIKKDLLSQYGSNRRGIVVKREIPKDKCQNTATPAEPTTPAVSETIPAKSAKVEAQATEPISHKENKTVKPATKTADPLQKQLSLLDENTDSVKPARQNHVPLYVPHDLLKHKYIIFKDEKTDERFKQANATIKINEALQTAQKHITVALLSMSGNYTTDQFESLEEAKSFIEAPLNINELNRFVDARDKDGNTKMISVRSILEWQIQR